MKKLEKLTPEQEASLPEFAEKWLKIGLSTEPLDLEKAKQCAIAAYEVAGLQAPVNFYRFQSPYSAAIGATYLKEIFSKEIAHVGDQVWDQVGAQVGDQVGDQVRAQVWDQVGAQVGDQVRAQVRAQVRDQVWDQVGAQVWDQVGAQVGDQVGDQVWAQVRAQVRDQVWDQVWDRVGAQVRDQVRAQVWDQAWAQVGAQAGDQVWAQVGAQVVAQVRDQVGAQAGDQVWDQVWDRVGAQVRDQVWAQVGAQVRDQVRAQAGDQVWDQVRAQVRAQVWDQARAQVWDQVGAQVRDQVYGFHDADWLGFYDALMSFGCSSEKLIPLMDLAKVCGWWAPYKNTVIFQDRPEIIKVDDAKRLHCENGPSVKYRDGFSVYSWHGIRIPMEWIENKNELTAKTALTWENVEQRRAACEIVGWAKILRELNAKTIDKNQNPFVGELIEVEIPEIGREKFLRVRCGTEREFALPVPPDMKRASQAQAWLNWTTEDMYLPQLRT